MKSLPITFDPWCRKLINFLDEIWEGIIFMGPRGADMIGRCAGIENGDFSRYFVRPVSSRNVMRKCGPQKSTIGSIGGGSASLLGRRAKKKKKIKYENHQRAYNKSRIIQFWCQKLLNFSKQILWIIYRDGERETPMMAGSIKWWKWRIRVRQMLKPSLHARFDLEHTRGLCIFFL